MPKKKVPWWVWLIIVIVVVVGVVFLYIVLCPPKDFRDAIAKEFNVHQKDLLFVNILPMPNRHPGSILLTWGGYSYDLVPRDHSLLIEGQIGSVRGAYKDMRASSGSVGADVVEVIAAARGSISLQFEIPDARAIEMNVPDIIQRLRMYKPEDDVNSAEDPWEKLSVVMRSFEGTLNITVEREQSLSLDAWAELKAALQDAVDESDAEIRLLQRSRNELLLSFEEASVFAYEAAKAAELMRNMPWVAPDRLDERPDASVAVGVLMELDPARVPELGRALEEIGTDAARQEIIELMRKESPMDRERGEIMLQALPAPAAVKESEPATLVQDADVGVRSWAVMQLGDQGQDALPFLGVALQDEDPSIRHLAAVSLSALDADPEEVTPVLKTAIEDQDPVIAGYALTTLGRFGPSAQAASGDIRALIAKQPGTERAEQAQDALQKIRPQ